MKRITVLLVILIGLTACSPAPTATVDASRDTPDTQLAPTNTSAAALSETADTTPTFRPTAVFATPEDLDRLLDDTPQMQAERAQLVERAIRPAVSDERVIEALSAVPRHSFVLTSNLSQTYNDHPLPIGYGQTISQPSLVAMMTELLQLEEGDKVLEIGTGSGYQAAILGEITSEVYTVEIIPELANSASAILNHLGYGHIRVDRRDGYFGWEEYAPFDAIIVTAAPDHLPQPLVRQLNPDGGRMVIPIGPVGNVQVLWLVTRDGDDISMERLLPVRFVPFIRESD